MADKAADADEVSDDEAGNLDKSETDDVKEETTTADDIVEGSSPKSDDEENDDDEVCTKLTSLSKNSASFLNISL